MSYCSSPVSQRSSFSCTCSPGCNSPSTAATTPSSSGAFSPKIEQLQSYTYNQPLSPSGQELSYACNFSPLNEIPYEYAPHQALSPTSTYLQPPSPNQSSYQPYNYQRQSPSLSSPLTNNSVPKYSGYPPASAFYGPALNSASSLSTPYASSSSSSPSSSRSQYRMKRSNRINPAEYKFETWYTADGRKVEYSPMHMNCATM